MPPAAPWFRYILAGALSAAAGSPAPIFAADTRSLPSRPTLAAVAPAATAAPSAASVILGDRAYIAVDDALRQLGCHVNAGSTNRRISFSDTKRRTGSLEGDTREMIWNGCRVLLGRPILVHNNRLYISEIDFSRGLLPRCRPDLLGTRPVPRVVVIDPGHGGIDNGTENRALGLLEKNLTLDVAKRLQPLLEAAGYRVILTRTKDQELTRDKRGDLDRRGAIANKNRADIFISIHFNAVPADARVRGTEVFTYAPAGQTSTDSWGHGSDDSVRESAPANAVDGWNVVLAQAVHAELLHVLQTEDRGEKIAHFRVLRDVTCPAVLVEPAIISNEAEGRRAADPKFRQRLAEALALGVRSYMLTVASLRLPAENIPATPSPVATSTPR